MRASKAAREYLQWASEKQRVECELEELWVSTKCGESDTTSGLRRQSHRRRRVRQALRGRLHAGVRRDDRAHRRRADRRRALPRRQGARRFHARVRPLPGSDQSPQDERSVRLAADQGQHRRRTDDDRGKGARQHPEDRQASASSTACSTRRRCPSGPGLWFMDSSSAAAGDGHAVRGVGLRRPFLPDRAGQRDRQSDPAGDQDLRQPAHGAHDERARRRRHHRACCSARSRWTRRATSCST